MSKPRERSRSLRRIQKKLPGGRLAKVFKPRKHKRKACPVYGTILPGVARGRPSEIRKLSKSERRPERPFGGVLGSQAMRDVFVKKARGEKDHV